jgi:hypothetical protein
MLTQDRVNQLIELAKTMKAEELQVLVGAAVLNHTQEMTIDFMNDDIGGYVDKEVYPGGDLWKQSADILGDLMNEHEVARALARNRIGSQFDIIIEKKWIARKK